MGYTHFDQVSGINGVGVGSKGNEVMAIDPNGNLLQNDNAVVFNHRTRVTAAQVNAGVEILPAIAGKAYRLVDFTIIAIGGAATDNTATELRGTRATAALILASIARANFTRSALLKPDSTGVTVLADGTSHTPLDANTAITLINDGAAMTGATHVDVIISGVIE